MNIFDRRRPPTNDSPPLHKCGRGRIEINPERWYADKRYRQKLRRQAQVVANQLGKIVELGTKKTVLDAISPHG